uniref:Uncharacterized protein n=1 Tax=Streptomyces rochei TaxID=1928 RepID=Q83WX5_STRRO|nr:hypothetical protein [Streptomyces rochei]
MPRPHPGTPRHRTHSMAGLPAAVRSGLLRAVCPLVVRAHRVHCIGIVRCGPAGRAGAGVLSRLGVHVLKVAQPIGREIEGFHVRTGRPQARSAVRSIASRRPGCCSWSSCSGSAGSGASNSSGIAAC